MKAVNHSSGLDGGFLPRRAQLSSEINVTPFVDVMLVLLIIFMVAAPLMTVGLPVDLPQASLNELAQETEPLNVIIAPGGVVHLGETEITKDTSFRNPFGAWVKRRASSGCASELTAR